MPWQINFEMDNNTSHAHIRIVAAAQTNLFNFFFSVDAVLS